MGPHVCVRGRVDRSGVCGRCRSRGSDLTLAARPGWTQSVALEVSVVLRFVCYAITTSRKGVLVRHMACKVTASFRANATLALRGKVLSAIALAQSRSRGPPRFRQEMAFAASNGHFLMNPSHRLDTRPFRLISPDSVRLGVSPR